MRKEFEKELGVRIDKLNDLFYENDYRVDSYNPYDMVVDYFARKYDKEFNYEEFISNKEIITFLLDKNVITEEEFLNEFDKALEIFEEEF